MVTAVGLRCSVLIMETLRQQQILSLVKSKSLKLYLFEFHTFC